MQSIHCSSKVLQYEHRRLERHLHLLTTQLSAGRWRWPGAAQDRLRRRLAALLAHQRGQHRAVLAARLASGPPAHCGSEQDALPEVEMDFLLPRDSSALIEALALLTALQAGDRSAAAPVVSAVLGASHALRRQLAAEALWLRALPGPGPVADAPSPASVRRTPTARTPRGLPMRGPARSASPRSGKST